LPDIAKRARRRHRDDRDRTLLLVDHRNMAEAFQDHEVESIGDAGVRRERNWITRHHFLETRAFEVHRSRRHLHQDVAFGENPGQLSRFNNQHARAPLVASRGRTRPFKEESESPFPATVVTLLIDFSGSMRGRPMLIAAMTVEIFARALERCGVRCEVLGFTTRDWDGGEPAREWAAASYPPNPGRLNALEHVIVKAADVPWRRARAGLGLFLHDELLKENIDGEAVLWAHQRLLASREQRRILIVVSDGTPVDEATAQANGFEYLDDHLYRVVRTIEQQSPIQLAAIGIGHDVSRVYRNATKIAKIDQLGPALTTKLIDLFNER